MYIHINLIKENEADYPSLSYAEKSAVHAGDNPSPLDSDSLRGIFTGILSFLLFSYLVCLLELGGSMILNWGSSVLEGVRVSSRAEETSKRYLFVTNKCRQLFLLSFTHTHSLSPPTL